ncbi:MAG: cell division protein ZapA [Hyphomicrobiaceae bacterium]|nr:cell division protein ZapA [Hyphomicrobiaceae bacterium]
MGEVIVTIHNRSFKLGCDDGEEEHLQILAGHIGKHVANLRETIGKTGDDQLYLMAGLMVCDELWEARELLIKTREILKERSEQKGASAPVASEKPALSPQLLQPSPVRRPAEQPVAAAPPVTPPPVPVIADTVK